MRHVYLVKFLEQGLINLGLGVLLFGCTTSPVVTSPQPSGSNTEVLSVPSPSVKPSESQTEAMPVEHGRLTQADLDPSPQLSTPQTGQGQVLPISAEAEIGDQIIQFEVARTADEKAKGLMYRPPLPDDRGMLFLFDPPRPVRFWMKNTPSPLDMIFLHDGEVQAIIANVPPCEADPCPTYGPDRPTLIDQVIELRSGRAEELGLEVGDRIIIQFLDSEL